MSDAARNQRWGTPVEIFARKLSLEDNDIPRGWLKNSIIIEPGTRACAVVDGRFIGEIPAGEFTFHDIRDKLQFWRQGTATICATSCRRPAGGGVHNRCIAKSRPPSSSVTGDASRCRWK